MQLPLLFTFKQLVMGNGFVAGVTMHGRALLEEEGDELWISGIAPVGLAGGGLDRDTAFAEFRKGWVSVLFDIASEADSFDDFKSQCSTFLGSESPHLTQEWESALASVRERNYKDPTLQSESADEQVVGFEVVELEPDSFAPDRNVLGNEPGSDVKAAA